MEFVSFMTEQKWNIMGPAAGVLIASVLGQSMDPSLAWLAGGSVMGGIMSVSGFRQKSILRVVSMVLFTGLAAGSIHYALSQFV